MAMNGFAVVLCFMWTAVGAIGVTATATGRDLGWLGWVVLFASLTTCGVIYDTLRLGRKTSETPRKTP
jgi:hypothetical protein